MEQDLSDTGSMVKELQQKLPLLETAGGKAVRQCTTDTSAAAASLQKRLQAQVHLPTLSATGLCNVPNATLLREC